MFDWSGVVIFLCDIFNCKLSVIDVLAEFIIAVALATVFVLMIEFHLIKFRFWKFCKIASMELRTFKKIKSSPIHTPNNTPTKKEMLHVIDFMKSHENLLLDATSIEKSTEIRYQLAVYREGLTRNDVDLTIQVYTSMSLFLEKLLKRYKPPRYIVLAANYFGGLRTLG